MYIRTLTQKATDTSKKLSFTKFKLHNQIELMLAARMEEESDQH